VWWQPELEKASDVCDEVPRGSTEVEIAAFLPMEIELGTAANSGKPPLDVVMTAMAIGSTVDFEMFSSMGEDRRVDCWGWRWTITLLQS
jgi:hypothetical protein